MKKHVIIPIAVAAVLLFFRPSLVIGMVIGAVLMALLMNLSFDEILTKLKTLKDRLF